VKQDRMRDPRVSAVSRGAVARSVVPGPEVCVLCRKAFLKLLSGEHSARAMSHVFALYVRNMTDEQVWLAVTPLEFRSRLLELDVRVLENVRACEVPKPVDQT
jgi:hypothetical protein